MGSFIARQPNGLICRFSTVVDAITHYNMTDEEYIEMCAEKAREEAREVLQDYIRPFEKVKKNFRPYNCTIDEFKTQLKEMGDENGLTEEEEKSFRDMEKHFNEG